MTVVTAGCVTTILDIGLFSSWLLRSFSFDAKALAVNGLTGAPVTVTAGLISLVVDRFDWDVADFDECPPFVGRFVDVSILTEMK